MNKNKQRFVHHDKDFKNIREFTVKSQCELLAFLLETLKPINLEDSYDFIFLSYII